MKTEIFKFYEAVKNTGSILIVPHISPDGDSVGSCVALQYMLKTMEKDSEIYINEPLSKKYSDFFDCFSIVPETDRIFDMVIYVDCAEEERACIKFPRPKLTCCIDHHISNPAYCDINIIDSNAPAAGEMMFEIAQILNIPLNSFAAKAIYMAIVCDTGGFLFDNTRKRTHEIASLLCDYDFNRYDIVEKTYLTKSLTYNKLLSKIMDELYTKGDFAVGFIDYETYKSYSTTSHDTDGLSNAIRNIEGINCGVLVTEKTQGLYKGSIRTNEKYDANMLANVFGGGGHIRAAGFTTEKSLQEIKDILNERLSSNK